MPTFQSSCSVEFYRISRTLRRRMLVPASIRASGDARAEDRRDTNLIYSSVA